MVNSKALKYARKKANLTQGDMAALIDKERQTYCMKESGDIPFSDQEKVLIAHKLGFDLDVFYCVFFDNEFQLANVEFRVDTHVDETGFYRC